MLFWQMERKPRRPAMLVALTGSVQGFQVAFRRCGIDTALLTSIINAHQKALSFALP